jgi:hypothetical protein
MPAPKKPAACELSHVLHWETLKELRTAVENKKLGMLTSGVVLLHDNACPHTLLAPEHCLSISSGSCLTTFLTALMSFGVTTICLPAWRTGWDHSASAIMSSWWKVSKHGWAQRRQICLTQTYRHLFPNTSALIPTMTRLRCSYKVPFLIAHFANSSPKITFRIPLLCKVKKVR